MSARFGPNFLLFCQACAESATTSKANRRDDTMSKSQDNETTIRWGRRYRDNLASSRDIKSPGIIDNVESVIERRDAKLSR